MKPNRKTIRTMILMTALLVCPVALAQAMPKDSIKVDVDDDGVVTIKLKVHCGELTTIQPKSECMKAVFKHAIVQAEALAKDAIERAATEERLKAAQKAHKDAAKAGKDAPKSESLPTEIDPNVQLR